jgi:hypothetical protein
LQSDSVLEKQRPGRLTAQYDKSLNSNLLGRDKDEELVENRFTLVNSNDVSNSFNRD